MGKVIDYRCGRCGAAGCKLWREYMVTADQTELLCVACAGDAEGVDIAKVDDKGCHNHARIGVPTCQIGGMVPAFLDAEGTGFWGFSSVPPDRVAWWEALPTWPYPTLRSLLTGLARSASGDGVAWVTHKNGAVVLLKEFARLRDVLEDIEQTGHNPADMAPDLIGDPAREWKLLQRIAGAAQKALTDTDSFVEVEQILRAFAPAQGSQTSDSEG